MSTNDVLSKLKAEIERLNLTNYCGTAEQYEEELFAIIDSLQQEQSCDTCTNDKGCVTCKDGELWEGKEQPYGGYDEAYLNEKIKKATESWKGVDVNKMLAESRGYDEPEVDLEAEIESMWNKASGFQPKFVTLEVKREGFGVIARHFYNLGKNSKL